MDNKKLKIVASIIAKPEYKEEVVALLKKVTDETRKEEGNISYGICVNVSDSLKFVILEEWKSQDAIDYHNQTPHFLLLKSELSKMAESLVIDVLTEVY